MCAATVANRSGSTAVVREAAAALAATVSILSAVRGGRRIEVRSGMLMPFMPCICMHIIAHEPSGDVNVTGPALPQPCRFTSPDMCDLACRVSQVVRPPQGRREAATQSCRDGHGSGRPGRCSSFRSPCARAGGC